MSIAVEDYRFAPAYELPSWPFVAPPELGSERVVRHPIVIVGAGPAGLTLACDLARRGVRALLLDEDDTVGVRGASSRGICYAQKSLEIFARLGIYERVAEKGITWSFGRTFSDRQEVYNFNLKTDSVSVQPPFINLQQFYVEWFLVDRILELGLTDLRWKNRVTQVTPLADGVRLQVETPAGTYTARLVAGDKTPSHPVPDVTKSDRATAEGALKAIRFVVVVDEQYVDATTPGIVVSQTPTGGKLAKGGTVTITVGQ